jgi:hypothetical protein
MLDHMATMLVCYGGNFESKLAAKIHKSSDLGEIWFSKLIMMLRIKIDRWFAMSAIFNHLKDHKMAPNSKNDDGYQFARTKSTGKPNFAQIGGFLYPWRPFWIQNGRHSKTTININSQHQGAIL